MNPKGLYVSRQDPGGYMRKYFSKPRNYTLVAATGLPVMLGMAAVTIDASRVQRARNEVNMAAESIAHAALMSMKDGDSAAAARRKAQQETEHPDL